MLPASRWLLYAVVYLLTVPVIADAPNPQLITWSTKSYGPDGPWHAISVDIGTPPQSLDLFPGGSWMSNILSSSICTNNAPLPANIQQRSGNVPCYAQQAGVYNASASSTSFQIGQTGSTDNSTFAGVTGALSTLYGSANWIFDSANFAVEDGVSGNSFNGTIQDFDMYVISEGLETLPDGSTYSAQVGKLALGAPNLTQTWLHFPPNPNWNGTFLPSSCFQTGRAPSNSYGMHIGSSAFQIPGSLIIGGYDQSRVLGAGSSQAYAIDNLPVALLDIGIGVAEGQSPFNSSSISGLLASGNASVGLSMQVLVDATSSYLYLPESTCDAITQYLPVAYQSNIGLYLWDTADPQYERIVTSPSFLSFTFRLNSSISQNLTINVPFALLNLTLEAPIMSYPTQYFPCSPYQVGTGNYALGRAFLQAVFVGVNWQTGNGKWFLAQAPGPNTPSHNPTTSISPDDDFIIASTNSWEDSWRGSWSLIDAANNASGNRTTGTTPSPPPPVHSGPSKGTIASICVGVFRAIVLLAAAVYLGRKAILRKKQDVHHSQQRLTDVKPKSGTYAIPPGTYRDTGFRPRELDSNYVYQRPVEMPG